MSCDIYIYPTDTVWGIGANYNCRESIEDIHAIKRTPLSKNLSLLFPSLRTLIEWIPSFEKISPDLVEELFSCESTFLIHKRYLSKTIPSHIVSEGEHLGCRYLGDRYASLSVDVPIVSTSLNLSGEPPISSREDAYSFYKTYAPQAVFLDEHFEMSGRSSSIIKVGVHL